MANFSRKETSYRPDTQFMKGRVLLNNYDDLKRDETTVSLKPYQAVVMEIQE